MKRYATLLIFTIFGTFVTAQTNFGVRTGFNISNLDFEGVIPNDNVHRNGLAIGFFADLQLFKGVSILAEGQFSAEGANSEDLRKDNVNVPVMLRFSIGDDFKIGLGPQLNHETEGFEKGFTNWAVSGIAGVEYMIDDMFFVDVRYSRGFTNIFQEPTKLDATSSNIQIGIGLKVF